MMLYICVKFHENISVFKLLSGHGFVMVFYIYVKFYENISNSFQVSWTQVHVYDGNHYLQYSKGCNSKSR